MFSRCIQSILAQQYFQLTIVYRDITPSAGAGGEESACQWRRCRFDPRVRKLPGGGHSNALQYCCLETPMGRGAWWASVHGVAESDVSKVHARAHNRIMRHRRSAFCSFIYTPSSVLKRPFIPKSCLVLFPK